uniref:Uncharacterized protein n=1 Tax=Salix viminalis TaxID=40686 RepID=A0A6N2N016_SALVM
MENAYDDTRFADMSKIQLFYRYLFRLKIKEEMYGDDCQARSKLETPITAPIMATSTTPPAAMLSKKFLREGETPAPAASATSGITMEAVSAPAVNPVTTFSFNEALT